MRKTTLGLLLTLTCATLFALIPLPGQEIDIPDMSDKNIKIISTNNIQFLDMSFDKSREYTAGDTIPVTFIAKNNDSTDYTDVYVSVYLSVFSASAKTTKSYGVQNKIGPYFVPQNSDKKVDFQYTLPRSAMIPADAEIILEANVMYGSGVKLGNIGIPIKVSGLTSSFDILKAHVQVGDRQYGLQEGPIISPTNPPKLFATISNLNSGTSTITPILKIYDRQSNKIEILDKKYESFSLSGKEMREISIVMPFFDKPGVYLGELYFVDSQNNTESPIIFIRWIVEGNMATIPSIISDKNFVQKGEKINIEVPYTGAPLNIDTLDTHKSGEAVMRVTVYDNMNGDIISTGEQKINLDIISSPLHFELEAQQESKSLKIAAVIIQEGKELVGYSTILTNPDTLIPSEKNNLFQILGGILFFLLVLFGIFRIRKKMVHTVGIFLFSLILLGCYDDVYASGQCFNATYYRGDNYANHTACGHANLSKAIFEPGEDMSPYITMSTEAGVCGNSSAYSIVNISIKPRDAQSTFIGQVINSNFTNGEWRNYGTFYPHTTNHTSKSIIAPTQPGEYVLQTGVYLYTYYPPYYDESTGETYTAEGLYGPASLDFAFTVIENGVCGSAQNKIYSSTATEYAPDIQCASGISSDNTFPGMGESKTWTCNGQYGGTPSGTCTSTRSFAPINGTCGTGAKIYPATATSYAPYDVQCGSGTPSITTFPAIGTSVTWTCSGQYEGAPSEMCTATRSLATITANCTASPISATTGQSITWTANNVLGGIGTYTYSWSGDESLSGITNPFSKTYTTAGMKNAFVLITSGTQTATVSCTTTITAPVDLCNNIEDTQTTVPAGLTRTEGNCTCGG